MKYIVIAFVICAMFPATSRAQSDADIQQALQLTQQMLKDPHERQKEIDKSPSGKQADQKVKDFAGSTENEQAIYDLAASVFGSMVQDTHGNPDQMQKILDDGMKHPEQFASKWSPEELEKLKKISEKVPDAKK